MAGYFFSLIGSDGTGKTTLSGLLKKKAENKFSKVSFFYMGSLNHALITSRILAKLSAISNRRKTPSKDNIKGPNNKNFNLISFFKELTFLHYILELFARYFLWIRPRVKNGEIVITDRYIYDFLIIDRRLNRYRWFKNLIIRIIPAPDLLICLYNDPEIIFKRKRDNTLEEIERQNKLFLALSQQVKTFKKFRTDGTAEELSNKIFQEMLDIVSMPRN